MYFLFENKVLKPTILTIVKNYNADLIDICSTFYSLKNENKIIPCVFYNDVQGHTFLRYTTKLSFASDI